jgi:hypothetical protein
MKVRGKVLIGVINGEDGIPILVLKADDAVGKKIVNQIYEKLEAVRFRALPFGKAGVNNVCGLTGNLSQVESLSVPLALGGISLSNKKELKNEKYENNRGVAGKAR